jgi:hypothetical protein
MQALRRFRRGEPRCLIGLEEVVSGVSNDGEVQREASFLVLRRSSPKVMSIVQGIVLDPPVGAHRGRMALGSGSRDVTE